MRNRILESVESDQIRSDLQLKKELKKEFKSLKG